MQKTVLITGCNGFVGKHTVREFYNNNWRVVGTSRDKTPHTETAPYIQTYISADLSNANATNETAWPQVDCVVHLAGIASNEFKDTETIVTTNVAVHTNLYTALVQQKQHPKILAVSSGAVYAAGTLPQTEESTLKEVSTARPYEASKLHLEEALKNYTSVLSIVTVRPFNHIGPGQGPGFLVPDIAHEIVHAKATGSPILTGNLHTKRDFTDVRDVARAYRLLAEATNVQSGTYNICSGTGTVCNDIVQWLRQYFSALDVVMTVDPSRIRPGEIEAIYGSYEKLHRLTGWEPRITTEQSIRDFVHWYQNS